jgi:hypothetical protein
MDAYGDRHTAAPSADVAVRRGYGHVHISREYERWVDTIWTRYWHDMDSEPSCCLGTVQVAASL